MDFLICFFLGEKKQIMHLRFYSNNRENISVGFIPLILQLIPSKNYKHSEFHFLRACSAIEKRNESKT